MKSKRCVYYGEEKPLDSFPPRNNRPDHPYQPYCRRCKNEKGVALYEKNRYHYACMTAEANGHPLALSKEEYDALTARPCCYCLLPLSPRGVGLDRHDRTRGYVLENVVPCCTLCNMTRADRFTPEEMVRHVGPAIRAVMEEREAAGGPLRLGKWHRERRAQ